MFAMIRMGTAATRGTCLLIGIQDSPTQHIGKEIMQVYRDL